MSEDPRDRGERALRRHDSVSAPTDGVARVTTTPFDATIAVGAGENGAVRFTTTARVPFIGEVTTETIADVVADGWADTFRRRVENVGRVTAGDHDLSPSVERDGNELVARVTLSDLDANRGANDAVAFADYVEGVYVQGVIPGYDYTEPVVGLIDAARAAGGSDPTRSDPS